MELVSPLLLPDYYYYYNIMWYKSSKHACEDMKQSQGTLNNYGQDSDEEWLLLYVATAVCVMLKRTRRIVDNKNNNTKIESCSASCKERDTKINVKGYVRLRQSQSTQSMSIHQSVSGERAEA